MQTDSTVCDVPSQTADPDNHQSLSRLPPKIWEKIFTFAYDARYTTPLSTIIRNDYFFEGALPGSCNQKHILNVIRRVCKSWREIVQSIPMLWTDIWLHDCWKIPKSAHRNLAEFISSRSYTLSDILTFSRDLPLRVFLHPDCCLYVQPEFFYDHSVAGLVHHAILILAQHSHRWTTLYISESHCQSVSQALSASLPLLDVTTLPLLTEIHFRWSGQDNYGYDSDGEDLSFQKSDFTLLGTPELRFLSIGLICPRDRALEWARLERVVFNEIEHHHCRRVLPHLVSVVEITVLQWETDLDELSDHSIAVHNDVVDFTLPRLETISVDQWDSQFFAFMKAPSLRNIHIHTLYGHIRKVAEFISHSSCSIETFTVDSMWSSSQDDEYSILFSSMPDLQTMRIGVPGDGYELVDGKGKERGIHTVVRALSGCVDRTDGQARPQNFPGLRTLSIILDLYDYPEPLTELVDEIRVRWTHAKTLPGGTGLCYVEGLPKDCERFRERYQACFESLREMEKEGLKVSYRTGRLKSRHYVRQS